MAGLFSKDKPIKLIRKEYECRQCHKKMCDIYVKPVDEDKYDDSYPICWPCFLEISKQIKDLKGDK